ncbi:MAG: hypothetical protein J0I12_31870 [Candidatus Eremiobacteraeota bacterium]|nr:hypothetical protein [Candidatus Eremiobacteraeota bacterium]
MNSWFLVSAGLIVCAGAIHSGLGEFLILTRMNPEHLPTTPFGGKAMTFHLLRGTWHLLTAVWLSLAAALVFYPAGDPRSAGVGLLVAALFALLGLGMLARDPRMLLRHPAPALFLAIATTAWIGCP